jgi:hypothetical protein
MLWPRIALYLLARGVPWDINLAANVASRPTAAHLMSDCY